jgi:hypothetical protein
VLWVDAICIDQGSAAEKSTQVPLMDKIYAAASRVIIWLGEGVLEDEMLFRRAQKCGRLTFVRNVSDDSVLSGWRLMRLVNKAISKLVFLGRPD